MIFRQLRVRYEWREPAAAFPGPWERLPAFARPEWRPPCDVYESAAEWVIQVELAGVEEQDVEVSLYEDGVLVEGRRPWRCSGSGEDLRVHAAEIRYGPFRAAVRLPSALEVAGAAVGYDRGMLSIRVPKRGAR